MPKKRKSKGKMHEIKKKPSLSQEEINSLEQMIKKNEEKKESSEFREFMEEPKIQKSSPSLNKINLPQRIPTRLEGNLSESETPNNNLNGETDPFKYTSGERKSEAKYAKYEGMVVENIVQKRDIQNIGRGKPFEGKEVMFENSPQTRMGLSESVEKLYSPPTKIDKDKTIKKDPFERKEIKYSPEKY